MRTFMKEIPLTQDKIALVDDEDFEHLSQHKWFANWDGWNWYAIRRGRKELGEDWHKKIKMHRVIVEGSIIDHKNGNTLDNRKSNLRICTSKQSAYNRGLRSDSESGFKGVSQRGRKWIARIISEGKRRSLGYFHTAEAAALAYNKAALETYGEFALLNEVKL